MPHPHDALIRAWLDGQTVQYLDGQLWRNIEPPAAVDKMPHFYSDQKYRLAPQVFRVRHALMRASSGPWVTMVTNLAEETTISQRPHFVRWLDDWTELQA